MANIKTLIKGDPQIDDASDIGVAHLPGCPSLDHETACGRVNTPAVFVYGQGKVTCMSCLAAAKNILENLTDAEIKQLRPTRNKERAVAAGEG